VLLYSRLARHYFDIENSGRDFQDELRYLCRLLKKEGVRSVIDIGCGTGEHVDELCRRGLKAEGLDFSEEMLDTARERFPDRKFHLGDMKSFRVGKKYDSGISVFGSFDYLLEDEDVIEALKNIHKILLPNAIFLLEVWNAEPLVRIVNKPLSPVSSTYSRGKKITRDRGFALVSERPCIVNVNYVYYVSGEELSDKHKMRAFYFDEIQGLVQSAGFFAEEISSERNGTLNRETGNRFLLSLRRI